ncbi:MAG: hypothetical protein RL702_407 [Pseudomonadota bacterium]
MESKSLRAAVYGAACICLAAAFPAVADDASSGSARAGATTNGVGSQFELVFWQSVQSSDDPAMFDAYLAQYPEGTFSKLAKLRIAAFARAAAPRAEPVQPAPLPAPVPAAPAGNAALAPAPFAATPLAATPAALAAPAAAPSAVAAPPPAGIAPVVTAPPVATPVAGSQAGVAAVNEPASYIVGNTAALGLLARTQSVAASGAVRPSIPARAQMEQVPVLTLPPQFCSAEERNAFHSGSYLPALATASRNNSKAVAYMASLQQLYDGFRHDQDTISLNAIVADSQAYHPVALAAMEAENRFVGLFGQLMAVPVRTCEAAK